MKNIINKFKKITKEEKVVIARNVVAGASVAVAGYIVGKAVKGCQTSKDIRYLNDNIDCLESDIYELEEIVDRQCLKIAYTNDVELFNLERGVYERDLAIMELVDGDTNRYRGIRGSVWSDEELLINTERLESETGKAKARYDAWLDARDELDYI